MGSIGGGEVAVRAGDDTVGARRQHERAPVGSRNGGRNGRNGARPVPAQAATRTSRLLRLLPPEHLAALVRCSHGVTGRRGDRLAGERDDTVTVLLGGVAASRTTTVDGEHVISAIHGPGDAHGLTAVLGHPEAADELIAIDAADGLSLPGAAVRDLVDRVPAAARLCLAAVAAEHAALRVEHVRFAASSTSARVEHRLLELADRFGQADGGRILVDLPLTQEELASWAQTSRESAAKVLQELRRMGIVSTGRRQLVIEDLAALRDRRRRRPDRTVAALLRDIG